MIPVSRQDKIGELVGLSIALTKQKYRSLYALNVIDNRSDDAGLKKRARALLETAVSAAAGANIHMHSLLRYDVNIVNAIVSAVRERNITDLVLGMHVAAPGSNLPIPGIPGAATAALGKTLQAVLAQCAVTTFIYHSAQPFPTIRRHLVVVPRKAELEAGFQAWLLRIRHLAHDTGAQLIFYAPADTIGHLRGRRRRKDIAQYVVRETGWENPAVLLPEIRKDDCLWVVMSRRERISYQAGMYRIPAYLDETLQDNSFVLVYPVQAGHAEQQGVFNMNLG